MLRGIVDMFTKYEDAVNYTETQSFSYPLTHNTPVRETPCPTGTVGGMNQSNHDEYKFSFGSYERKFMHLNSAESFS